MQCPRCLAQNREGRRFCAECGAPLAPLFLLWVLERTGEKFCGGCGLALLPPTDPLTRPRVPRTHTLRATLPIKS